MAGFAMFVGASGACGSAGRLEDRRVARRT